MARRLQHDRVTGVIMRVVCKLMAMCFLCTASAFAQSSEPFYWSVIGATGIADESSMSTVSFSDTGSASIKSSVSSADVKLRYPITGGPSHVDVFDAVPCMLVSFRDTGSTARVLVSFRALNRATGDITTFGTFDSDASGAPASAHYQAGQVCPMGQLDPSGAMAQFNNRDFAYYMDVDLIKTATSGNPGLKFIRLAVE